MDQQLIATWAPHPATHTHTPEETNHSFPSQFLESLAFSVTDSKLYCYFPFQPGTLSADGKQWVVTPLMEPGVFSLVQRWENLWSRNEAACAQTLWRGDQGVGAGMGGKEAWSLSSGETFSSGLFLIFPSPRPTSDPPMSYSRHVPQSLVVSG